jgi:hypothetical protein
MGVPAEDVIHIKNLSVSDGVMGISPISASQDVFLRKEPKRAPSGGGANGGLGTVDQ